MTQPHMPARHLRRDIGLRLRHVRGLIRTRLWAQILIALALGIAFGLVFSPEVGAAFDLSDQTIALMGEWLHLPGGIFLNLIQMVVIALISTSIVLGITSAGDPQYLARVATRIIPYFLATTTVAVFIGILVSRLIEPSGFLDPGSLEVDPTLTVDIDQLGDQSLASQIADLIPANLSEAGLSRNMLQIVIAAIMAGVAILSLGPKRTAPLLELMQLVQDVAMTIISWAMRLAPLAVFGLIAEFVMQAGLSALIGLSAYMATVILGLICLLGVYVLIVWTVAKQAPFAFLSKIFDAQLLAFSTSSSAATMPLSLRVAETRLNVPKPLAGFVIPLGATVNMDGTALYQVVAALFITGAFGIQLTPPELALLVVTVVGASIGSPSTPGVGIVILASILAGLGVPPSGVAILLGVDRLLDMCRTAVNVTGDLTACVVMDRWLPNPETNAVREENSVSKKA
ncbi:MAG: dicarboxylate/amino acid:cation symporter [Pseudomonadota bacterium]